MEQTDFNPFGKSHECDSSQDQADNDHEEGVENKETHLLPLILLAGVLIKSEASSSKAPAGEEKLRKICESAADTHVASSFIQLIQHDPELSKVAACPEWMDISVSGGQQKAAVVVGWMHARGRI